MIAKVLKKSFLGISLLTAGIPFLCCWTPAFLIGLASILGVSSSFEWVHQFRPYLFGFSFVILGFAHFRQYHPLKRLKIDDGYPDQCNCKKNGKKTTYYKWILWVTTLLVFVLTLANYIID